MIIYLDPMSTHDGYNKYSPNENGLKGGYPQNLMNMGICTNIIVSNTHNMKYLNLILKIKIM